MMLQDCLKDIFKKFYAKNLKKKYEKNAKALDGTLIR